MSAADRIVEVHTYSAGALVFMGFSQQTNQHDEDSESVGVQEWQSRASLREFDIDSNSSRVVIDYELRLHFNLNGFADEETLLRSVWISQETLLAPVFWEHSTAIYGLPDDEVPSSSGIERIGDVYSISIEAGLILQP